MRLFLTLFLVLSSLPVWGASMEFTHPPATQGVAPSSVWRYGRPDAQILVGLNWQKLMKEAPGNLLRKQVEQAGMASAGDLESLNSITQVLFSTVAPTNSKSEPPVIITLKGHFSLAKIRSFALSKKATIRGYKTIEVITPAHATATDMHVALVDGETILLADRASLRQAIDRANENANPLAGNPLYQRAMAMAGQHDIWFVASRNALQGSAHELDTMPLLKSVDLVEGGLRFADQVYLKVDLHTGSDSSANALAAVISSLAQMAPAGKRGGPAGELLEKLTVSTEQGSVRMGVALDPKEIQQGFAQLAPQLGELTAGNFDLQSLMAAAPKTATAPAVAAPADDTPTFKAEVEAKLPVTKYIHIYGLEGGTRTIPLPE